ncbi:MAG: serine hydrolase [Gemmatimonadales bacterium]|nr:serine hydrolase [Gemmatimonadales bacterium]
MRAILAIAALLVPLNRAATAQAPVAAPRGDSVRVLDAADLERWLGGLVPDGLARGGIAGLVIAVVKDGAVLFEKGFGWADVAGRVPMDPEGTVIRVASVSKAFTAAAALQLVGQGKLDLDRDVNEYLDFQIPPAFGAPITLRHLLTHTAGFEETAYPRFVPPASLRRHLLRIPDRIYPPGTVPAYSNYSLNLAGYLVERVSGLTIADYVERHLLGPLGMTRSTFRMTVPEALARHEARNYRVASDSTYPPNLIHELSPVDAPASGLSTTAGDMTRFLLALLQRGRVGDTQVLEPETVALMQSAAFVPMAGAQPIGLGLFHTGTSGRRVVGHSGDGEGFHAEFRVLPDEGIGIFVAMNSDGTVDGLFPAAFALRTRLLEQFVDRYFPRPSRPAELATTTGAAHARLAAGEYLWSRQSTGDYQEALALVGRFLGLDLVIRANPDGTIETPPALTFSTDGRRRTWREFEPFVWREVGGEARLLMDVRDGRVRSVWSDATASFWVNLRVPALRTARLNGPLLGVTALTLLMAAVFWPVALLVERRRRRRAARVDDGSTRWQRRTALLAVVAVVYLVGWFLVMAMDAPSSLRSGPWIRLLQIVGVALLAGAAVAIRNAWQAWRRPGGLGARVAGTLVAGALVYLGWFSLAFHLISLRLP